MATTRATGPGCTQGCAQAYAYAAIVMLYSHHKPQTDTMLRHTEGGYRAYSSKSGTGGSAVPPSRPPIGGCWARLIGSRPGAPTAGTRGALPLGRGAGLNHTTNCQPSM